MVTDWLKVSVTLTWSVFTPSLSACKTVTGTSTRQLLLASTVTLCDPESRSDMDWRGACGFCYT
ncbi:hypothetical protein GCM10011513_24170 [Franconibacter daqui]|nr:hypothetical protein GCM10011513_24170 [Franconibacter daqui]